MSWFSGNPLKKAEDLVTGARDEVVSHQREIWGVAGGAIASAYATQLYGAKAYMDRQARNQQDVADEAVAAEQQRQEDQQAVLDAGHAAEVANAGRVRTPRVRLGANAADTGNATFSGLSIPLLSSTTAPGLSL